jgi:predicted DNA-binding transcriptional regulator AlpA
MNTPLITPDPLLSQPRVLALLGVSSMTLWRWRQVSGFPAPTTINGRNYWRRGVVDAWIDGQPVCGLSRKQEGA